MRFCWAQYSLWAAVAVLGMLSLFSGCGAKGDLFMPPPEPVEKSSVAAPEAADDAVPETPAEAEPSSGDETINDLPPSQ